MGENSGKGCENQRGKYVDNQAVGLLAETAAREYIMLHVFENYVSMLDVFDGGCVIMADTKILYWDGAITQNDFNDDKVKEVIEKLLAGNCAGVNLEKLNKGKEQPIYSARLNDSERLLLTTVTQVVDGDKLHYLLVLERTKHYKQARFLNPKVLAAYLQCNETEFEKLVFEEYDKLEGINATQKSEIKYIKRTYSEGKFISLDELQAGALLLSSPVTILCGAAGSGKTILIPIILCQHADKNFGQSLVLAESENLVNSIREHYEAHPDVIAAGKVEDTDFLSYKELALRSDKSLEGKNFAGIKEFKYWLFYTDKGKDLLAKLLKQKGSRSLKQQQREEQESQFLAEKLYQEFRLLSVITTSDEYLALGVRKSSFEEVQKTVVWNGFDSYKNYLNTDTINAVDLAWYTFAPTQRYNVIIVDESQDFSPLQNKIITELSCKKMVFNIDPQQSMHDTVSALGKLEEILTLKRIHYVKKELKHAYRSSGEVAAFASIVLGLKLQVTDGKIENEDYTVLEPSKLQTGLVEFVLSNKTDFLRQKDSELDVSLAVVIESERFRENAKEKYGTPLVFTPEEIKGLEYRVIVLDNFFTVTTEKNLGEIDFSNMTTYHNRSKNKKAAGEGHSKALFLQRLFTAITRSYSQLFVVVEPEICCKLVEFLKLEVKRAQNSAYTYKGGKQSWAVEFNKTTANDLAKEIEKQRVLGNLQQAADLASMQKEMQGGNMPELDFQQHIKEFQTNSNKTILERIKRITPISKESPLYPVTFTLSNFRNMVCSHTVDLTGDEHKNSAVTLAVTKAALNTILYEEGKGVFATLCERAWPFTRANLPKVVEEEFQARLFNNILVIFSAYRIGSNNIAMYAKKDKHSSISGRSLIDRVFCNSNNVMYVETRSSLTPIAILVPEMLLGLAKDALDSTLHDKIKVVKSKKISLKKFPPIMDELFGIKLENPFEVTVPDYEQGLMDFADNRKKIFGVHTIRLSTEFDYMARFFASLASSEELIREVGARVIVRHEDGSGWALVHKAYSSIPKDIKEKLSLDNQDEIERFLLLQKQIIQAKGDIILRMCDDKLNRYQILGLQSNGVKILDLGYTKMLGIPKLKDQYCQDLIFMEKKGRELQQHEEAATRIQTMFREYMRRNKLRRECQPNDSKGEGNIPIPRATASKLPV